MSTLEEVRAARERLRGHVRTTPVVGFDGLHLKLEQLQVGGSFKARGAFNRLLCASRAELAAGVVTASGGNHGVGVACAARELRVPAVVHLPVTAPVATERRLEGLGAKVERGGASWDDAWDRASARARESGALLVHPFEDPAVIAGQGTIGLELVEQVPDVDTVVVAIGGGGLIGGVGVALAGVRPGARVVGVEPTGATSMLESLRAGRVVKLDAVKTIAGTLAPRAVGPRTLGLAAAHVREVVLVSDEEMLEAVKVLWDELRLLVEPAGAAALAAVRAGRVARTGRVAVLVCGANMDTELATRVVGGKL